MLVSIKKVCVSVALCILTSACSGLPVTEKKALTQNNTSAKEATEKVTPSAKVSTETWQFLAAAITIYGLTKIENGVEIATLVTDYKKKQLEVKNGVVQQ